MTAHSCHFFLKSAFDDAELVSTGRKWFIANLSIDVFFSLVEDKKHDPQFDCKKTARILFDSGVLFSELPFLILQPISSGETLVWEHNGRHRGMVLLEEGYSTMPVLFILGEEKKEWLQWPKKIKAEHYSEDPKFTIPLPPRLDPAHWPGDSDLSGVGV